MNLTRSLVSLILGCGVTFSSGSMGYCQEAKPDQKLEQKVESVLEKADKLWTEGKIDEAIQMYLSQKTCHEIMGDSVEYVTYNIETKKNNFEDLVYQTNIEKEKRKPVLVLFYHNDGDIYSKHNSIIMRRLSMQYSGNLIILGFRANADPTLLEDNYSLLFKKYNFGAIPAFQMYGPSDVVKGETPQQNDGIVELLNTRHKGPGNIETLKRWLQSFPEYWIEPNLTNPNGIFTYRFSDPRPVTPETKQLVEKILYKK